MSNEIMIVLTYILLLICNFSIQLNKNLGYVDKGLLKTPDIISSRKLKKIINIVKFIIPVYVFPWVAMLSVPLVIHIIFGDGQPTVIGYTTLFDQEVVQSFFISSIFGIMAILNVTYNILEHLGQKRYEPVKTQSIIKKKPKSSSRATIYSRKNRG